MSIRKKVFPNSHDAGLPKVPRVPFWAAQANKVSYKRSGAFA